MNDELKPIYLSAIENELSKHAPLTYGNDDSERKDEDRGWSFSRQHRYDIKKPGPPYLYHEELQSNEKVNGSPASIVQSLGSNSSAPSLQTQLEAVDASRTYIIFSNE